MSDTLHLILLGNSGDAKTSLLQTYISKKRSYSKSTTISVEYNSCQFRHRRKNYAVCIWDTPGNDRFSELIKVFLGKMRKDKSTHGILLCYDITNKKSFDDLTNKYLALLDEVYGSAFHRPPLYMVCTKSDLEETPMLSNDYINDFCEMNGIIEWWKVSCKTMFNVSEPFDFAMRDVLIQPIKTEFDQKSVTNGRSGIMSKCVNRFRKSFYQIGCI